MEDTQGVIRSCKSKRDRQCKGQEKMDKRTNNDLQSITPNVNSGVISMDIQILLNINLVYT